ncbi:MAG: antibiotic biosynthesis monooxygenase [Rhodospirillales bacterium]
MLAVIFEVWPREGLADDYFGLALSLKPALEKMDGFISVERFESVTSPGKFLSLSFWRDEAAIKNWYGFGGHADAQDQGRGGIFKDYRIRVASVMRDYDMANGRPAVDG